jgi:hypothetical protein
LLCKFQLSTFEKDLMPTISYIETKRFVGKNCTIMASGVTMHNESDRWLEWTLDTDYEGLEIFCSSMSPGH